MAILQDESSLISDATNLRNWSEDGNAYAEVLEVLNHVVQVRSLMLSDVERVRVALFNSSRRSKVEVTDIDKRLIQSVFLFSFNPFAQQEHAF